MYFVYSEMLKRKQTVANNEQKYISILNNDDKRWNIFQYFRLKKKAKPLQLLFNAPIQLQAIDFISLHVFSFHFIHELLFNLYFINPLFTGTELV